MLNCIKAALLLGVLFSFQMGCSHKPTKAAPATASVQAGRSKPAPIKRVVAEQQDGTEEHETTLPQEGKLPEINSNNTPAGVVPPGYFDWPVFEARMTRGFFTKPKKRRGRPHWGIDLASHKGTPILASHDGTVIYVGREFHGYGRLIMIEGRGGFATLYGHLSRSRVRIGERVKQGQTIGDMGNTGRSTGVHLHFEIRRRSGPIDPLQYLPGGAKIAGSQ